METARQDADTDRDARILPSRFLLVLNACYVTVKSVKTDSRRIR